MPEVSYYPGCSLEATAKDYAESVEGVCEALDIELRELPDWNCCGASAAHSLDHRAALNLGARNLALAAQGPSPLVVPCALCYNRLASARHELLEGDDLVIDEIKALGGGYAGVEVVELNDYLSSPEVTALAKQRATDLDLSGLKAVCYYGCQGQRPPAVTGKADYENPQGLDRLLGALGVTVMDWPFKTDCCGASHSVPRPDLVFTLVAKLYKRALDQGANCIVTGCQMCQANLDMYQEEIAKQMGKQVYLPVLYFTEVMGLALGIDETPKWLKRHLVSPKGLLEKAQLPRQTWERL
ncbi:MAG: CoB--CoM heterodisulfide reductase iron-sulfur subunit B family protein [Desulfarculaceae bacterium]|nr:CoB--CoM heterodisulfide reductase iron-sulfur subunit B family protein [Desulfarculaceae bacterium]MCF8046377.1 CoB--CoM heterodisulfide reductase iron-sulfur subunit B family protein [Desulfarculaceae bacterium]MCF8064857.1 CoB--CoM heterodisulfide reductase iron-sulfur subunit B family protein [Desulfarculaceae bacterium]MCF8123207.1 CoB--CoM heterodisulfide reductase iron-sulfur subunit B family protein [Desulfarculaceae bacterium]